MDVHPTKNVSIGIDPPIYSEDQWRVSGGDTYLNHFLPTGGFRNRDQPWPVFQVDSSGYGVIMSVKSKILLANESWLLPLW